MFWKRSRASASDPDKLREQLQRVFHRAGKGELFTLDDLVAEVGTGQKESVAFLLTQLASSRVVDQIIRVVSPRGGGIADYPSVDLIKNPLYDPYQLKDIEVEPQLIKVFFTKHTEDKESDSLGSDRTHAVI